MDYRQAVDYIQGAAGQGSKNGLANMRALLQRLGRPQDAYPCVHVAGTNGKGSMCAYLESALRAAGHRTGLYTSPFLQRYNERIRIGGAPIEDEELARVTSFVAGAVEELRGEGVRPTFFEIGTAVCFEAFRRAGVTFAVVEVGLGGRLDPTNVVEPLACVIGSIGLDHMKLLGGTLPLIAREKGGIIKPNTPLAVYPLAEEALSPLREMAAEKNAPLWYAGDADVRVLRGDLADQRFAYAYSGASFPEVRIRLAGEHQIANAATALTALLALRSRGVRLPDEAVLKGFASAAWPGRLELVAGEPPMLLDGAHNEPAARTLRAAVERHFSGRRVALVTGIMADKAYRAVAEQFASFAQTVVCVAPESHRALPAQTLQELYLSLGRPAQAAPDVAAALSMARAAAPDVIVVSGSLYLVGAARTLLGL